MKALKNFFEKLCKEVKKNRDKKQRLGLKNAKTNTSPQTAKHYEASMCKSFFLLSSLYKTNRFHAAMVNISDTLICGSCATSFFFTTF